jgi:hypothetical protein
MPSALWALISLAQACTSKLFPHERTDSRVKTNTIAEFFKRLSSDTAFRDLAREKPDMALEGYQLSTAERQALRDLLRDGNSNKIATTGFWH